MERSWSLESDIFFSMEIGAHILIEKIYCYNKCTNYWLYGCEELCAEVAITLQVVGYLRCIIYHEFA